MADSDEIIGHQLQQTVFTHTHLFSAAEAALKEARHSDEQRCCMVAIVMAAFSLEAFINFAGESVFPFWREVERIRTEGKLRMICQQSRYQPDFGQRPYQSLSELWRVRNILAHATTKTLTEARDGPPLEPLAYPMTEWEKACVLDRAERLVADAGDVMHDLYRRANLRRGALGQISERGGEILRSRRSGEGG